MFLYCEKELILRLVLSANVYSLSSRKATHIQSVPQSIGSPTFPSFIFHSLEKGCPLPFIVTGCVLVLVDMAYPKDIQRQTCAVEGSIYSSNNMLTL